MDVKLSIDDQETWKGRRQRLEALIGAGPSQRQHDPAQPLRTMDPLLYSAAKEGDVHKFIDALEDYCKKEGVSLSVVLGSYGPSRSTLLHAAAESDDIVRALIDFVPEGLISQKNSRQETPLHIAARAGKTGAVELLLPRLTTRDTDVNGNSALHEAVRNCRSEVIRRLVREDPNQLYHRNYQSKSPLCLAIETDNLDVLKLLLEAPNPVETGDLTMLHDNLQRIHDVFGMSPVHVAVLHQRKGMLTEMWQKKPWLFQLRDEGFGTPLHFAAYTNYLDGVKFLIEKFPLSAMDQDNEGYYPIHVACMMDHVEIVKELLRQWPDPAEFLAKEGENILHVSARYGCISTVKYILKSSKLCHLIEARDFYGNTPLHVAASHWQPSVLLLLTRDKRVAPEVVKAVNNRNMTALDVTEEDMKEMDAPLRKRLTRIILASVQKPRSGELAISKGIRWNLGKEMQPPKLDRLQEEVNTRMVVVSLVAAMTFASGFSVPGGYNGSDPDAGIAILLHRTMYNVFVICNCIAMYGSIITLVILLWTQINDPYAVQNALSISRLPLLVTLAAMPVAFMAGVFVTVSKLAWLGIVVLVLGSVALLIILSFYLLFYIPLECSRPLIRPFTDLIIVVGISMSGSGTAGRATTPSGAPRDFDNRIQNRMAHHEESDCMIS